MGIGIYETEFDEIIGVHQFIREDFGNNHSINWSERTGIPRINDIYFSNPGSIGISNRDVKNILERLPRLKLELACHRILDDASDKTMNSDIDKRTKPKRKLLTRHFPDFREGMEFDLNQYSPEQIGLTFKRVVDYCRNIEMERHYAQKWRFVF